MKKICRKRNFSGKKLAFALFCYYLCIEILISDASAYFQPLSFANVEYMRYLLNLNICQTEKQQNLVNTDYALLTVFQTSLPKIVINFAAE